MIFITPESYLSQLNDIRKEIQCLDHGRRTILSTTLQSTQLQQDKSFSLEVSKPSEKVIIKLEEYEESISEKQKELISLLGVISREIDEVPIRNHRILLTYRYTYGLNMRQVADKMHYNYTYCFDVHRNALKSFKETHFDKSWFPTSESI